jgi:hypothetical protein
MVNLFAGPTIEDNWKELEYCVRTGLTRVVPTAGRVSVIEGVPR